MHTQKFELTCPSESLSVAYNEKFLCLVHTEHLFYT